MDSYRELILIFLEKHAEQEKKLIALSIRDNMRKFNFSEEESTVGSIKIPASGVIWEAI